MSLLNLAIGGNFVEIGSITSPPKALGYQADFQIPFFADLIRVKVTLYGFKKADWYRAGYVLQRWTGTSGKSSVLSTSRIYIDDPKIMQIEPVTDSVIEFHPANWLHSWTCAVEARAYTSSPELIILDKLTQIQTKLDSLGQ